MNDTPIKIGLVGCGGRGTGAAENCLQSAKNIEIVALADMFPDRLNGCRKYLADTKHAGVKIEDKNCFTGFDAYQRILDTGVELVLFATPPGFRPMHVEAAVDAGKHVFMEKPVAVDPVGCRKILEIGKKAEQKKLTVVAGTQYRHQEGFMQCMKRVHDGAIGDVRAGRIYYNGGGAWHYDRKPAESDMEFQIRNWYYYDWLSGDFIVEQHIHTIDVMVWAMKGPPMRATATGGRTQRVGPKYGNIYDHFAVDYEYPGGVHILSMNRHWDGAPGHVGAYFHGSKGMAMPYGVKKEWASEITGPNAWTYAGPATLGSAYVTEHADLIASIRSGAAVNESKQVADSTLTAIMGRQAAYTGKTVTWDEMTKSLIDYSPDEYVFGPLPERPVPMPGKV